jgi:hypothetical protein
MGCESIRMADVPERNPGTSLLRLVRRASLVIPFAVVLVASPSMAASPLDLRSLDQPDAASYAVTYVVSDGEALRRLDLQVEAGKLSGYLEANGASWFGGLWIDHEPTFA